MSVYGGFGVPGQDTAVFDSPNEIVSQGFDADQFVLDSAVISASTVDAGASPTFAIRPGLILGLVASTGKYLQWDSTATDGSQYARAILWKELRMQDFNGNTVDRVFTVIVGRGIMRASKLWVKGTALTSAADQYLARRQLANAMFVMDDDPFSYLAGTMKRTVSKSTDYTVLPSDNGTKFRATGAATFTLPTLASGLVYEFINTADNTITITAADATSVIWDGSAGVTSLAFSTGSHKIGGHLRYSANEAATKWEVEQLGPSGCAVTAT